ncbi:CoA pyrophosphatase [Halomonas litopenaei]|uniref:CoA pyrophosphatase n=2 Tax=Halomonas TaxID=2745 RepID=A0AAU7KQC0_9GAMM|nr:MULTISPECIES: CoA pyrophosphatase [Halomonas]MBR9772893.1 CoA pyrophosphatase [Gammaproteobacteria bacterium]MBY6112679.1 CoA pyrophosphatase [Halomonas sp. DP1Y21-3]PTL90110.1 CoA pyrophosphatase [Halomonas sp. SYSU XM8]PTL92600.1 CoA pyrophosphatase [Halomonas litopenaei]RQW71374.1 CoA pyrophosphatase [Halomonas sp. YLB-10]
MLEKLRKRLQAHSPRRLTLKLPEAAVLIPLVDRPEPGLLFTRRASHLSTHSGQVAFPGGKREPHDADLLATALRESEEEIGLPPGQVEVLGQLSDVLSLHGLKVTPFVGLIPPDLPLVPDLGELDAIFEVPLSHFIDDQRTHTDVIPVDGNDIYVPSYLIPADQGDDYVIWGLSAMMLVELLAKGCDLDMSLSRRPEGRLRHLPPRRAPR